MRDEYLPKTRSTVAWTALPDGQAWYAFHVQEHTTTTMTPEEIHALGLSEVARIRNEMDECGSRWASRATSRRSSRSSRPTRSSISRTARNCSRAIATLKTRIDAALPKLFSVFPKADYEVREVEAFRAQSAAGASYQQPSADGSRPGIFYVNTYNLKAQPKFGMETLSLHEAAPGHHFQIAIQQELQDVPRFRRFGGDYTAFVEGWALYAESLGKELGLFTDPYQWYRPPQRRECCARCAWSSTPGCTRRAGAVSRRSSTCSTTPRWRSPMSRPRSSVHRVAGPGARLQGGRHQDPGTAARGAAGAGREVRRARLPSRSPVRRCRAAGRAAEEDRPLEGGATLMPGELRLSRAALPSLLAVVALRRRRLRFRGPATAAARRDPVAADRAAEGEQRRGDQALSHRRDLLRPVPGAEPDLRDGTRRSPVRRPLRRLRERQLDGGLARHRAGGARAPRRGRSRAAGAAKTWSRTRPSSASAN